MPRLSLVCQRMSSLSGSFSAVTPVWAGFPQKNGQSAEREETQKSAMTAPATRNRRRAIAHLRRVGTAHRFAEWWAMPTLQCRLVQPEQVRFADRPRVEAGGPLLVGFLGEQRQNAVADAAG